MVKIEEFKYESDPVKYIGIKITFGEWFSEAVFERDFLSESHATIYAAQFHRKLSEKTSVSLEEIEKPLLAFFDSIK